MGKCGKGTGSFGAFSPGHLPALGHSYCCGSAAHCRAAVSVGPRPFPLRSAHGIHDEHAALQRYHSPLTEHAPRRPCMQPMHVAWVAAMIRSCDSVAKTHASTSMAVAVPAHVSRLPAPNGYLCCVALCR